MFEQFSKFLSIRDYFGAGMILSSLGQMLDAPGSREPEGFFDAQVRVVALDDCLHIFMLLASRDDFWTLPGDQVTARSHHGVQLISKRVALSDLYSPDCRTPVQLHFLYAYEDAGSVLEA